ncbi:MAG TPA: hypothetical protein VNA16_03330 [Abditibacteriaceae bacterium]|nr:hypothetical protein [Abditibacteriaceae bacterium]
MTQLLEKAFAEAAKLSEDEQNSFAALMLEELASERRWDEAFAHSQQQLAQLAAAALAEHRAGRTRLLNVDEL